MKRRERGFWIVTGIVSLSSQLPSCNKAATSTGSDLESVRNTDQSCMKGSTSDFGALTACKKLMEWAQTVKNASVTKVIVSKDGDLVIEVNSRSDATNIATAMDKNLQFIGDGDTWKFYNTTQDRKEGAARKDGGDFHTVILKDTTMNSKGGKGG